MKLVVRKITPMGPRTEVRSIQDRATAEQMARELSAPEGSDAAAVPSSGAVNMAAWLVEHKRRREAAKAHPLERVMRALEAAKPSNVIKMRVG